MNSGQTERGDPGEFVGEHYANGARFSCFTPPRHLNAAGGAERGVAGEEWRGATFRVRAPLRGAYVVPVRVHSGHVAGLSNLKTFII